MEYREIKTAPEMKRISVVWGKNYRTPEFGVALRVGTQWNIYGQSNPHANGRPCADPDGWMPKHGTERIDAAKRLCDILVQHHNIQR
ncbi:MAG: hypothetical protein ABIH34_08240 [Nanoarchaeota archaeon]